LVTQPNLIGANHGLLLRSGGLKRTVVCTENLIRKRFQFLQINFPVLALKFPVP
jgi:hypothetical protein